jgi:tetratricopeptide (TPR) repeat protein
MKRPQLVSSGTLNRILKAAEEAWYARDYPKNIELLERASRLDPANPEICIHLGHALGMRFDYEAAERSFEKALRLTRTMPEVLATIALKCRGFSKLKLAEHYFRQAVQQTNGSPEMLVPLAELYERVRRVEEADTLITQALEVKCDFPSALLARARLHRQSGRLEEAEEVLRMLLPKADRAIQIRGYYELGSVLDRQQRYEEAMAAFLEAKTLTKPDAPAHVRALQIMRARLTALRESITPQLLERWRSRGSFLQPAQRLVLLCGHPRSGTTLLEQILDSHPDVISAEETEIFHDEAFMPLTRGYPEETPILSFLESAREGALLKSRENYLQILEKFLEAPIANRLLIDKNPSFTFLIPHFIRIFPETKFLVALRDPRDVCLSCFMQPFYPVGQVSSAYLTMEGTIKEYVELMTMYQTVSPLIENSRHEVRYEDTVEDLESVCRRVLEFFGLKWDARVLRFNEHAQTKIVRSPTYADVTKPVFKRAVGRWRNYEKYLAPHLEKLAPFAKAFGYE